MHILSVNVFKVGNMYLRKSHLTKLKKKKTTKKNYYPMHNNTCIVQNSRG